MEFIKGMDISFLPQILDQGAVFYDSQGSEREVFLLLKENGVNSIRLRIWNEPENVPESGGYCDLKHTIAMAKKIKQHGMSFFLDFHYSDWWADPGKQNKPKAWEGLSFEDLKQAVYDYTKDVLLKMQQEGVMPDLVQIGNEIRSGMLFPDGEVPHYDCLIQLVNEGIAAVREVGKEYGTKVVIHLDQGGRYFYLRDWFDSALAAGLDDFDIIGVSYYPFWHGTFAEFKDTLVKLVERYKKPIIIAETAHAWRKTADGFIGEQQEKIAGFPATPEAQRKVIDLVMNITASLKEDMGLGIYYWEPVVIPIKGEGGWASNMGIFDEEGKALPALECFKFDRSQFKPKEIAKIYEPGKVLEEIGKEVMLPRTVRVLYYDGSCPEIPVEWKTFDNSKAGNIVVEGFLAKINEYVSITIELVEKLKEDYNFIANGDFEEGLTGWEVEASDDRIKIELHPEFIDPFPAPPVNYLYIESPVNFTLDLTKELKGLVPGEYNLQVEYRGTNTTGVDVKLFAETNEKQWETIIYPTDEDWTLYQISNIMVGNGGIKLGLKLSSPPVFGKIRRFQLTRNT
ncbi:MAG: hypothetical protein GX288_06435 [Clostridiales bacterium]|nr:hypothetical protein [Clostridiales bacterium]